MRKKNAHIERMIMKLTENKYITKAVAGLLARDHWTMGMIATVPARTLEKYRGIGKATAKKIVNEARRLVNQARLNEAALHLPPSVDAAEPAAEEQPMSVRVRRIKEQK